MTQMRKLLYGLAKLQDSVSVARWLIDYDLRRADLLSKAIEIIILHDCMRLLTIHLFMESLIMLGYKCIHCTCIWQGCLSVAINAFCSAAY